MPKQTKICRVCGATYEACNSIRTGSDVFNWREVACSPKCGMMYLEKITASRDASKKPDMQKTSKKASHKKGTAKEVRVHEENNIVDFQNVVVDDVALDEEAEASIDMEGNIE